MFDEFRPRRKQQILQDRAPFWSLGIRAIIKYAAFCNRLLKTKTKYDISGKKTRRLWQKLKQATYFLDLENRLT